MDGRGRNWCFTLNNYTDEQVSIIKCIDCKYICFGFEVAPTTGTPHLQGCIVFDNSARFNFVKLCFPESTHLELMRGRIEQNQVYCKKDGQWYERGIAPVSSIVKGQMEKARYVEAWDHAKNGKFEDVEPALRMKFYRTIKQVHSDYMQKPADLDEPCGVWFYGVPGAGKSHSARTTFPDSYMKACNKWWCSYQNQDNVIIDDFDLNHSCLGHHLKIWADKYAFISETKGSNLFIRPKKIVVTSNHSIEEIFSSDVSLVIALNRRFDVKYFDKIYKPKTGPLDDVFLSKTKKSRVE